MVQDQRSRGENRATGAAGASCGGGGSGQAAAGDHFGLWMAWENGGCTKGNWLVQPDFSKKNSFFFENQWKKNGDVAEMTCHLI